MHASDPSQHDETFRMGVAQILIIEDDEPLRTLLQYNLESEGYDVETCARGDSADNILRTHRPDLLILDWMLPGLSGIEILRKLRIQGPIYRPWVIMLTGRCTTDDRNRGIATGADDYIIKPFSVPGLLRRVRDLLIRNTARQVGQTK